ncbi:MAG: MBL fold metallo-hydrolase [Woeseiaceae bacterium]|nr:MBL fold metallo-hydrolase [Woeseiaceae bacterium]
MRRLVTTLLLLSMGASWAEPACPPPEGVALQVLGSGGPIADDARASTAYVVWADGRSRALIDMGSGSFVRFGEARVDFTELDFVGLSHFHTDHAADFVALLKSGNFAGRERPLPLAGPSGNRRFPGLHDFLAASIDPETGAYRYLGGYLDGSGGLPRLVPTEVAGDADATEDLLGNSESTIAVYAQRVPHGIVPALGFRVEVEGRSIVFSSDQNGSDPAFIDFAKHASLLVVHMVIPEGAGERAKQLHAEPSRIGEVAAAAGAERLLLSHFMARSLRDLDGNVQRVADSYDGDILLAEDLGCYPIP